MVNVAVNLRVPQALRSTNAAAARPLHPVFSEVFAFGAHARR